MQATIQLTTVLLLALLSVGCANVKVVFDEREDLSEYQTWDWLAAEGSSVDVAHGDAMAVDSHLSRLIEQRLGENGYTRSEIEPDFFVAYRLVQRHRDVLVNEPSAITQLSSLHSSPSYLIEGSRLATRRYSELRLGIIAYRSGVGIWHAKFGQYDDELNAVSVSAAAATLLEGLPRRRQASRHRTTKSSSTLGPTFVEHP